MIRGKGYVIRPGSVGDPDVIRTSLCTVLGPAWTLFFLCATLSSPPCVMHWSLVAASGAQPSALSQAHLRSRSPPAWMRCGRGAYRRAKGWSTKAKLIPDLSDSDRSGICLAFLEAVCLAEGARGMHTRSARLCEAPRSRSMVAAAEHHPSTEYHNYLSD